MPDFRSSLSKPLESIERPPLAPAGVYRFKITKPAVFGEVNSANGNWDTVTFLLQAQEAIDVADVDALNAFGPVRNVNLSQRFMFPKGDSPEDKINYVRTENRLRSFLERHLGLSASLSMAEALDQAVGQECLGTVGYRQDRDDPEVMYAELKQTAPLGA